MFYVLIDFSWMLHRSYHAYRNLSVVVDGTRISTATLVGPTRFLESILKKQPKAELIFCLDSPFNRRRQTAEFYKGNREDHSDVYHLKDDIMMVLSLCPQVKFAFSMELEADDVIASLVFANPRKDSIIFSGDNDLAQLKQFGASISRKLSKGNFEILGEDYFIESCGIESEYLAHWKAIKGDASDNIPSAVPRLKKEVAEEFVKTWKGSDLGSAIEAWYGTRYYDKLKEAESDIRRNYDLVSLDHNENVKVNPVRYSADSSLLDKYKLYSYKGFLLEHGYI